MVFLKTLWIGLIFSFICIHPSSASLQKPKLILSIVIDQFRADYLTRFESKFLPPHQKNGQVGGFRYLMSKGAYYPHGQYDTMQSITAPGHATILTGSYPYQSGIPLNQWYDSKQGKVVLATEDLESPLVGVPKDAKNLGMSPKNLNGTTIGDELKNAGYPSKVISISLKDRSAILLGGHRADLALWYDASSNRWISSQYYLPNGELPLWVGLLNKELSAYSNHNYEWKLEHQETGFSASDAMPLTNPKNAGAIGGKNFPHSALFGNSSILYTPKSVELVEQAAERAINFYHLGKGQTPDLLAVSFSTHDIVGHSFGPNSREAEEITYVEDRAISRLLNYVQKKIPGGLSNVVISFTADHGAPPSPEWAKTQKLPSGRINTHEVVKSLSEKLNNRFGKLDPKDWVVYAGDLNIVLNRTAIRSKGLDQSQVETEAKSFLSQVPGVAYVFTSTDYQQRTLPPGIFERQILHTYNPGKNGDLILIPKPYFIPGGESQSTTTHTTGYSYDRTVPIIISGKYIKPGIYSQRAEVVDIAPTLSLLIGTIPPSLCEGRALSEALQLNR